MRIRLATYQDFEVYKALYEDDYISVLYPMIESEVKPQQKSESIDFFQFDEASLNQIMEHFKMTRERYEKELADPKNYRIYLIEENNEIIGFAMLFKIERTRWKLAEFNVIRKYQGQKTVTDITDKLVNQLNIKTIDVCLFKEAYETMRNAGFEQLHANYFRKSRN